MVLENLSSYDLTLGCIILILIIVGIILYYLKELLDLLSNICIYLGDFIKNNSGFFSIFFIFIFFIEQLIFIIIITLFFNISINLQAFIGIFALIVITTATLQKFIWEYKYQNLSRQVYIVSMKNEKFLLESKELIDENEKMSEKLRNLKIKLKK